MTLRGPLTAGAMLAILLLDADLSPGQQAGNTPSARTQALSVLAHRFGTSGMHGKCGLPVISAAIRARASLLPEEGLALATILQRTERQTSIIADSGRFRFHFDTAGTQVPALLDASGNRIEGTARAFVDSAIAIITYVYAYETGTLGFRPPPSDGTLGGGPEYDIYISHIGADGDYGFTTPDYAAGTGDTSSTFIDIDNDFSFVTPAANRGIPSLRVTLAHEFHHAIQIGSYAYWASDVWFHEITSVWMEDVVYHGENDYLNYLYDADSQFHVPGTQLSSNDFIMYSRGILGKYFTKRFGPNTMLHVWQNIHGMQPLPAIDLTLHQIPSQASSLAVAFAEWTLWNYYTGPRADTVNYYNESPLFPVIVESYFDLISPTQQITGNISCLGSAYYGFASGTDTVTVALANLDTGCPAGAPTTSPFTLTVSRNKPDDTYRAIAGGLFLKLDVTNASQWIAWSIGRQGPTTTSTGEGSAFPNPFNPGGGGVLYFPANSDQGTLAVYSSGMELVYSRFLQTQSRLGQRVFAWDGLTNRNAVAPTGVYIFVLSLPGRTVTGKFALVRR